MSRYAMEYIANISLYITPWVDLIRKQHKNEFMIFIFMLISNKSKWHIVKSLLVIKTWKMLVSQ